MAVFVNPTTGERYENVPDAEAQRARDLYGLIPESEYEAGSAVNVVRTGVEEAGRKVVSGAAAVARGLESTAAAESRAAGVPEANIGVPTQVTGKDLAPSLFDAAALERREVNPTATTIGGAAPVALAGVLAPATGGLSLAAGLGIDSADAIAQEALDAELEGRGFEPVNALRNAGLNTLFSVGGVALVGAGRAALPKVKNLVQQGAESVAERIGVREALPTAELDKTLRKVDSDLERLKRPPVDNNRASQRAAIEALSERYERGNPEIAKALESALGGSGASRRQALRTLADELPDEADKAAVEELLGRESLWGRRIVEHDAARARLAERPSLDATPAQLSTFADDLRAVGLAKRADAVDAVARSKGLDPIRRPRRSVGAAGDVEQMTDAEAAMLLNKQEDIKHNLRVLAGGTSREAKGAAQDFSDTFRDVVNNATKHSDFAKFESSLDDAGQAALRAKVTELAESARPVVQAYEAVQSPAALKIRGFIDDAIKNPNASSLDRLKNALQAARAKAAKAQTGDVRASGLVEVIDGVEPQLRSALENPDIVGPSLAELQKTRNALWSNPDSGFIRAQRRLKAAGFDLWDVVEHDYDGRIVLQTDQRALKNLIDADPQIARPALDALEDLLEASKAMALNTVEVGADSAARGPIMKLTQAAEGMLDYVKGVRKLHAAQQLMSGEQTLAQQAAGYLGRYGAAQTGAAIGGAIGGLPGAAVGGLAGHMLQKPLIAGAERAVRAFSKEGVRESVSVGMARRRLKQALGLGAGAATVGAVGTADAAEIIENDAEQARIEAAQGLVHPDEVERLGDVPSPFARFLDVDSDPYAAFQRHREQLDAFAQSPTKLTGAVDELLGGLPPRARAAAASQAFQIVNFLREKMPGRRGVSVARPKGTPPSPMQLRTYALYATAALDPSSVMADARAGRLRREQVETLQRLWPAEYLGLRNAVIEQLGRGSSTAARQRMNLLFGFDASIDPALGRKVSKMVADARASKTQPDLGSQKTPGIDSRTLPSQAADAPAGQVAMQMTASGGR